MVNRIDGRKDQQSASRHARVLCIICTELHLIFNFEKTSEIQNFSERFNVIPTLEEIPPFDLKVEEKIDKQKIKELFEKAFSHSLFSFSFDVLHEKKNIRITLLNGHSQCSWHHGDNSSKVRTHPGSTNEAKF